MQHLTRVWTVKGRKPETSVKGSERLPCLSKMYLTCVRFIGGEVSWGYFAF